MPAGFGTATAAFVVVASMVGVGVLTTSGYTVAAVGSNQLMLGLWALGGAVALCGALTIAELSAMLPRSGGDYVYLREAYGPLVAFLSGWVSFVIGFAGPIALAASASAGYLLAPLGLEPATATRAGQGIATALIVAFAVVHTSGRGKTVAVQGTVTILKLVALVVFAVAGLVAGRGGWANLDDRPPIDAATVGAMLTSLIYISYGYTGWNAAAYLAGEVRDPRRQLPQAVLIGTLGVTALYLALNTVYALALPAAELRRIAAEEGPGRIAQVAELSAVRLFGARAAAPLSAAIGLMLWSTVSAYVLTGPRIFYAMAITGQFPAVAARLSARTKTPAAATWLLVAWSLVLLWAAPFDKLLNYASVGLAIFSMLTIAAVFVLRARRPDLPRPFRVPGYPAVPAFFLLVTAALTAMAFIKEVQGGAGPAVYALLSILAGVPFYYLWQRLAGPRLA